MYALQRQPIWDPDTGIAELDASPDDLSDPQIPEIRAAWAVVRKQLEDAGQLSEFTERLGREWSIETGAIEDLYDIVPEAAQSLIKRGFLPTLLGADMTNQPPEYVLRMLHDQKAALDGIYGFVESDRGMTSSYMKELHQALANSQDTTEGIDSLGRLVDFSLVKGKWKTRPNYPVRDGIMYAYCPPEQVDSEMDRLVAMHASHASRGVPCEVQAAWLHHRFAQIHPFQDGNGRVARSIATHVLVKHGLLPLVVTRGDKPAYLDALEATDKHGLKPFITLIAQLQMVQLRKAEEFAQKL